MLSGPISLEGAPDAFIGTPEAKVKAVQVMQLEISNDVLEDLVESVRRKKQPHVVFGRTPTLRYDGNSHSLLTAPEKFRNELYRSGDGDQENEWNFAGLINYSLEVQKVEEAAVGMDKALETLKSHMAAIEQEKEARKLTISTPEIRASKGANLASKAKIRATHLQPLLPSSARSLPSSPALRASSPCLAPPLSAGLDSPTDTAVKKTLTHFLAIRPRESLVCRRIVGTNVDKWLEKIAKTSNEDKYYQLLDKSYKDLDVWNFKYQTDEDRQTAIDNAIRAYDRMRLSRDDELWQKLLPREERGKGKVLSRLNLQNGPLKGTPVVKPKTIDRKTGLPKRSEVKKTDKDKEAVKGKKGKDTSEEEPIIKVARSKNEGRTPKPNTPRPDTTKERKAAKKEADSTTSRKEVKPSTAAKGLLNKPKNPSPLSASPPVNATDFEDDHPVHKALSAAISPKRGKANGDTPHRTNGIKRKAAELDSDTSTPNKARKVNGTNSHGHTNGHRSPPSDNSSGSPPLALSWRQSLDLAKKFRIYYDRYAKLYMELSESPEAPSQAKRDQLLNMHRKLEEMKREVRSGAL